MVYFFFFFFSIILEKMEMGSSSSLKTCFILLFFCLLNVFTISSKPLSKESVLFGGNFPALYVIGDSLVDSGNNNHLDTLAKSNFPPYGSDFEGGKSTGRFGNGKTIADYIAIYYELPLVPAYMGLSEEQKNNISTGINYASASCGILPDTGKIVGECLSLSVQVDLFKETIDKNLKKKFKPQPELSKHLADSLFMTAIGVNDYSFFYNKTMDANDFANKLIHEFFIQIQRLHGLGVRKFFVNNLKPLGCYPNIIAHTVPHGSCDNDLNLAVSIYNAKLRRSLTHMKQKLSNTSFLYSDYFNFMLGLRGPSSNHASSNLLNTTSPCCPSIYDGGALTGCSANSSSCAMPDTHIFFDPFHPTQLANFRREKFAMW
ncbi:GDSL esterase/lipase At2g03980 [Raphanus sativus]|uniref:GDSL esterase/lipase At2g03980 n=1 Tax=Raphanus sativus TaxID=3726 RepID=A0A6J0N9K1_RAPSA|nr:GDSL esterase/lipase At2g03980 [Raphanus sativus]